MVFSDVDIRNAIKEKRIRISPLQQDQIGPGNVDLTLSDEWYFFKKKYLDTLVDLKKLTHKEVYEKKKLKSVILLPGEMCLGKTLEKITLAPDIMGKLEGRSRYARMGLSIHITSAVIQPGSSNRQVLEIVNLAPFPVMLHKGMRISQVIFLEAKSPTSKPYAKHGKIARVQ